jgi:fructuronate reductase
MAAVGGDWGICAISLRSPDMRDRLAPQGDVYTSVTLTPDGPKHDVVSSIAQVLVAPDDPAAVLAAMAHPEVKIVSMTITEKGYCHNPATGLLRLEDPDIMYDLAHPDTPKTAIGFLVGALAIRRKNGDAPFTVLSGA